MQFYFDKKRENDPHALPDGEVFFADAGELGEDEEGEPNEAGWYWWACFPGYLPNSLPMGPFRTRKAALENAREGVVVDY
jgi:hypothetical protein